MNSRIVFLALIVAVSIGAGAELQQVQVGGQVRIRGNYMNLDSIGRSSFVEQRTRLNVRADFSQDLSAFIELDNYRVWGANEPETPFASWYLCGNDFRGSGDTAFLYQSYIEVRNMWELPFRMRVGRQEIMLGNQFLIGNNDASSLFYGRYYDALRLTVGGDLFSVDAIVAKLTENYGDFARDDLDLYVLYGSYTGLEGVAFDAYWTYFRDEDGVIGRLLIDAGDIDLHTVGLRGAGAIGAFDFEVEGAYQFGNVHHARNPWFRLFNRYADVDVGAFALNTEVGYTLDTNWQPRFFARFAYLDGGKPNNRWWNNDRRMPFSRLYSNVRYSEFLDNWTGDNGALSNVFFHALGVEAKPTEALALKLTGAYLHADKPLHRRNRGSRAYGWEIGGYMDYQYSNDLMLRVGYAHFFGKTGLETPPARWSGLQPWAGDRKDDYDYLFVETELHF